MDRDHTEGDKEVEYKANSDNKECNHHNSKSQLKVDMEEDEGEVVNPTNKIIEEQIPIEKIDKEAMAIRVMREYNHITLLISFNRETKEVRESGKPGNQIQLGREDNKGGKTPGEGKDPEQTHRTKQALLRLMPQAIHSLKITRSLLKMN